MKKILISRILDLIPLVILIGYVVNLIIIVSTSNIVLQKVHYAGLSFVVVAIIVFFINHKIGVIFLGVTIVTGLIGLLSLSPAVNTTYIGTGALKISFQAIFLLWALIHFIISGKHYVGIATSAYWDEIFDKGISDTKNVDH